MTMRSVRTTCWLFIFLLFAAAFPLVGCHKPSVSAQSATSPQAPATILIIRHAEKLTDGSIDLAPEGYARAQLLINAFLPPGVRADLPAPQYIFAAAPSAHSNRSALTVIPLAQALHLEVNQDYKDHDYARLAAELFSGSYAGKVVLISWHHGKIPELARALGATPPYNPWPDQQFDRIWRIDYTNGAAILQDLPYKPTPPPAK